MSDITRRETLLMTAGVSWVAAAPARAVAPPNGPSQGPPREPKAAGRPVSLRDFERLAHGTMALEAWEFINTYPANYWRYPTTWKDIEWARSQTKLPLVLKGIVDPEDADRGIRAGAAAIYVSNHGGRNLDTLPATLEVLPEVAD
jgi:isopentenyl diphosphate isomerase/L-lactate dehydrogenase-like FMN-dependent dehydrogenase